MKINKRTRIYKQSRNHLRDTLGRKETYKISRYIHKVHILKHENQTLEQKDIKKNKKKN